MLELERRPLGKPMTSEDYAELTASMKGSAARRTPEERTQFLIEAGILDENGELKKKFHHPLLIEMFYGSPKPSGGDT